MVHWGTGAFGHWRLVHSGWVARLGLPAQRLDGPDGPNEVLLVDVAVSVFSNVEQRCQHLFVLHQRILELHDDVAAPEQLVELLELELS